LTFFFAGFLIFFFLFFGVCAKRDRGIARADSGVELCSLKVVATGMMKINRSVDRNLLSRYLLTLGRHIFLL
jgi:hypothetical protein